MADVLQGRRHVPTKFWVPIGNKDFSSVIAAHSRRCRRDLCRARRRRRRQLPDPVPAGRRHGAADRRLDHGRPDGARLQGQAPATSSSARRRPDRSPTTTTTPEWKNVRRRLQDAVPDGFPSPSLFAHGYYINTKAVLTGARQGQWRRLRRRRQVARDARRARVRHADRQGEARQEPQRDRRHLPDRGRARAPTATSTTRSSR